MGAVSDQIARFEHVIADMFGRRHGIAVSSGTAALHCALAAAGVNSGDEVIVPALSVPMSVAPILYLRAVPVFVDCIPDRVELDFAQLDQAISPRVRAVVAVHLWGFICDMPGLWAWAAARNIVVIEDACQAHGSTIAGRPAGSWGAAACLSFRRGKLIATGEGGMVLCDDDAIAEHTRALRNHGVSSPSAAPITRLGFNYRLSSLQAREGLDQTASFEARLARRRLAASRIADAFAEHPTLRPMESAPDERPNGYSPVLVAGEASDLALRLAAAGVPNSVGTFGLRPAFGHPALGEPGRVLPCPNVSSLLRRVVAPVLPGSVDDGQIADLVGTLRRQARIVLTRPEPPRKLDLDHATFVVLDFETVTPPGRPAEPIEVAAMLIGPGLVADPKPVIDELIRPPHGAPLTPFDTSQTGIRSVDVANARDASVVLADFHAQVGNAGFVFVAQNARYEQRVLELYRHACPGLAASPFIDTVKLARIVLPDLSDHKLDTLVRRLRVPMPANRHRALPDVQMTVAVFLKLLGIWREANRSWSLSALLYEAGIKTPPAQASQASLF